MKPTHVFVLLAAFFLVSRSEAQVTDARLAELKAIIEDTNLWEISNTAGRRAVAAAIREVRGADGCDPNLCFAIDGSRQLGLSDFNLQLEFMKIITAIVGADDRANFAGVQYGLRNRQIRTIRGNADDFLLDIERVRYSRARRSFIGGGVAWCTDQLQKRRGEANKMVLFGDGRSSYGNLGGALGPVAMADDFRSRSPANVVCAVAVGFQRTDLFTDIVGGDSSLVLKVTDWPRVLEIVRQLVRDICAVEPVFRR